MLELINGREGFGHLELMAIQQRKREKLVEMGQLS